jgi:hypothetical protein
MSHERGFAGAVGTGQHNKFSLTDTEVDAVDTQRAVRKPVDEIPHFYDKIVLGFHIFIISHMKDAN